MLEKCGISVTMRKRHGVNYKWGKLCICYTQKLIAWKTHKRCKSSKEILNSLPLFKYTNFHNTSICIILHISLSGIPTYHVDCSAKVFMSVAVMREKADLVLFFYSKACVFILLWKLYQKAMRIMWYGSRTQIWSCCKLQYLGFSFSQRTRTVVQPSGRIYWFTCEITGPAQSIHFLNFVCVCVCVVKQPELV